MREAEHLVVKTIVAILVIAIIALGSWKIYKEQHLKNDAEIERGRALHEEHIGRIKAKTQQILRESGQ